jgi:hypothetical protein
MGGAVVKHLLIAVGVVACVNPAPSYTCDPTDPNACIGPAGEHGACESTHNCSFPDSTCGSAGQRYDSSAAAGRAGVCIVPAIPALPIAVPPQPLASGGAIGVEVHSPGNQMVIFDDAGSGTTTAAVLFLSTGPCPPSNPIISAGPGSGCAPPFARFAEIVNASAYCLVATQAETSGQIEMNIYPSIASPPGC